MQEYKIEIKETLSRIVTVVADNADNARDIVHDQYCDQGTVLDAGDFQDVEFEVVE